MTSHWGGSGVPRGGRGGAGGRHGRKQRRSQVSLVGGGLTEFQGGNKPQYLYL